MREKNIIPDEDINLKMHQLGFTASADEGRLMALELLCKAAAGFYNSHTEELFLKSLNLMTKQRKPNSRGFKFICYMVYASSLKKPPCYAAMRDSRR